MKKNFIGTEGSLLAALIYEDILKDRKQWLFVTESYKEAEKLSSDLAFFLRGERDIFLMEGEDDSFALFEASNREVLMEKLKVIEAVLKNQPLIAVMPVTTALKFIPPKKVFKRGSLILKVGEEKNIGDLIAELFDLGYISSNMVYAQGQFSKRGDIVDVFSSTADYPLRIEFFEDEIESIRSFDPTTQRTVKKYSEQSIFFATVFGSYKDLKVRAEGSLREKYRKNLGRFEELKLAIDTGQLHQLEFYVRSLYEEGISFWKYFKEGEIILLNPENLCNRIEQRGISYKEMFLDYLKEEKVLQREFENFPLTEDLLELLRWKNTSVVNRFISNGKNDLSEIFDNAVAVSVSSSKGMDFGGKLEFLKREVAKYTEEGYETVIVLSKEKREIIETALVDFLGKYTKTGGRLLIKEGILSNGFVFPEKKSYYITEGEIFGQARRKIRRKTVKGEQIKTFSDIRKGDFVVHEIHGIGRYAGIRQLTISGGIKDYLQIDYAGEGKLYVPAESLKLVQKYIGSGGTVPKLNSLSDNSSWIKTKLKARESIEGMAEALLMTSAKRAASEGYAFAPDDQWQKSFEEKFPYVETEDQLKAIEEIKADMECSIPMDRLLCGDVGYGKTEVVARAIFKCVSQGKQAVLLVPTTILASQHYNNLSKRFKDFPVNIEVLSRFTSSAKEKKIKGELESGKLDFIIGTHKLISKSVVYRDLGLLAVDEEQRFGVMQKEYIKNFKANVDLLTISATPIPRTLNMSLVGLRDMSVIEEPPARRRPVQTYVMEENRKVVKEAIEFEMKRKGQIFVVFNRVRGIRTLAEHIKELVPDAAVGVAHGRMTEGELAVVMEKFSNKEIDVLVSTSIIETGIDIPNVNTEIIFNADRFGLAQLYQLKGRVGRSEKKAYAYLFHKQRKLLSEKSIMRLQAIQEFTELGAGFKIAMRDLEIRGMGNLLGEEQSGHIMAVGYEMYCKLVKETVAKIKGEEIKEAEEVRINIPVEACINRDYIKEENIRMEIYNKISNIQNREDKRELTAELKDRFGTIPEDVRNLIFIALIQNYCIQSGIERVWVKEKKIFLKYKEYTSPMELEVETEEPIIFEIEAILFGLLNR